MQILNSIDKDLNILFFYLIQNTTLHSYNNKIFDFNLIIIIIITLTIININFNIIINKRHYIHIYINFDKNASNIDKILIGNYNKFVKNG